MTKERTNVKMCNLAYVTSLIYKSGHVYNHMSIRAYLYVQSGDYSQSQYVINNSLSFIMSANTKLSPVIDASHTTPTTRVINASHTTPTARVNRSPKLLKLREETLSML